jgi:hypothetical protein
LRGDGTIAVNPVGGSADGTLYLWLFKPGEFIKESGFYGGCNGNSLCLSACFPRDNSISVSPQRLTIDQTSL